MSYSGLHPSTTTPPPALVEAALRRCDTLAGLSDEERLAFASLLTWYFTPGGTVLARRGDACDDMMLVIGGRIRLWGEADPRTGFRPIIGDAGPGGLIGEIELQGDRVQGGDVEALRDTEVGVMSLEAFEKFANERPILWRAIARSMLRYVGLETRQTGRTDTRETFVIVPAGADVPLQQFADRLSAAIRKLDPVTWLRLDAVDHSGFTYLAHDDIDEWTDTDRNFVKWLGEREEESRFVFLESSLGLSPWSTRCVRQADRVLIVAMAGADPKPLSSELMVFDARGNREGPVELVLLHADNELPSNTADWLAWRPDVDAVYHVRLSDDRHVERLARTLSGRAIGLVLGGGGARGNAHIGVIKALIELGVPIDQAGGTSAGGGVSAMLAAGRDTERIRRDSDNAFVQMAPFSAFDIPYSSLIQRNAVDAPAQWLFGDTDIEDLWLPWFAVSCDIGSGTLVVHRRGRVWKAVRATSALPGVLPPIHIRGKVLVDGGIVDNTPIKIMRQMRPGPCILVNVSPPEENLVGDDVLDLPTNFDVVMSNLHPMLTHRKVPTIGKVIVQTMCVSGVGANDGATADLFIEPAISPYGIVEFEAMDELIALGYNATMEAIEKNIHNTELLARFALDPARLKLPLPRMEVPVWQSAERRRAQAIRNIARNILGMTLAGATIGLLGFSALFQEIQTWGAYVGGLFGLVPALFALVDTETPLNAVKR